MINSLGLGGGGMKGILHIGALLELQKRQKLFFKDGVFGCSVGSILATWIAFEIPIHNMKPIIQKYFKAELFVEKFSPQHIANVFSKNGAYSMDTLRNLLIQVFSEVGLNIADKKLQDAHMPLKIVASNLTKGVPTIFQKNIPILDAICCSCAFPGIFQPQILYKQMYIDGYFFSPCLSELFPDAVVLSLRSDAASANNLLSYTNLIFANVIKQLHNKQANKNTVCLTYPGLSSSSDLSKFDVDDILKVAGEQFKKRITLIENPEIKNEV